MASRLASISAGDNLPSQLQLKQRPSAEKTFLQKKVPKLEHEEENVDIILTIVLVGSSSVTTEQVLGLLEQFLFILKLWRQRIALLRDENNAKYKELTDLFFTRVVTLVT